jgi:hypothetical protein
LVGEQHQQAGIEHDQSVNAAKDDSEPGDKALVQWVRQ